MSNWPLSSGVRYETSGMSGGTGTLLTAPGSTHTKSAYTQILAATGFQYDGIFVTLRPNVVDIDFLVDIAVGGAGSEKVIASDIAVSSRSNAVSSAMGTYVVFLPIRVPSGSRLALRYQASATTASALVVGLQGVAGDAKMRAGYRKAVGLADLTTSRGITVDPGATLATEGAYSQLVASSSVRAVGIIFTFGSAGDGAKSTTNITMDIAYGAAASEKIILTDILLCLSSATNTPLPRMTGPYPVDIPAASRIAARAMPSVSIATASQRRFDLCAILLAA